MANEHSIERGAKWWIRYVLVPLFGAGGFAAVLVALITRCTVPPPTSSSLPPIVKTQNNINFIVPGITNLQQPTTDVPSKINGRASGDKEKRQGYPRESSINHTVEQPIVVTPNPPPDPTPVKTGGFCCDSKGIPRCASIILPVGTECICDGQGVGVICQ